MSCILEQSHSTRYPDGFFHLFFNLDILVKLERDGSLAASRIDVLFLPDTSAVI